LKLNHDKLLSNFAFNFTLRRYSLGVLFEEAFPYLGKAPCISSVGGTSWVKDRGDKGMMEA
jgi:hypothetical protein